MTQKHLFADAKPTKSLILDALTTDIDLTDAILDLIDNSVDGIQRVPIAQRTWSNYSINIRFDEKKFEIEDNCGGIDAKVARDYAFRFGRPSGRAPERGLLGMYGVGMKRAIFKMGNRFKVSSCTKKSKFEIEADLKTWRADDEQWGFEFNEFEENTSVAQEEVGTQIRIESLFEAISQEFQNPQFQSDLIKKAAKAHRKALGEGLHVVVNDIPLEAAGFKLLSSAAIQPARLSKEFKKVSVLLYAGVAESNPKEAGWYVFCNGRMVLEADQSGRTVWGESGDISIPKIHNQFARFRGFAFFESDDQQQLPWTSTKSGINSSSPIYRSARQQMVLISRPVISFLNELDREKDAEKRPRHESIKAAKPTPLTDIQQLETDFKYSGKNAPSQDMMRISFQRSKEQIEAAKRKLDVASNKEVGEKVFDYWYRFEIGKK